MQGIRYIAFSDSSGYGIAARSYREMLQQCGIPFIWDPLIPKSRRFPWLHRTDLGYEVRGTMDSATMARYDRLLLHTVPEYFPILLAAEQPDIKQSLLTTGMTVWETDRLPRHWPALLNALDQVIVPTEWNRQVFVDSGVRIPISVVPHASQFEGRPPEHAALESLRKKLPNLQGKYIFYSIGTWLERKGNLALLRAFTQAFAGRQDVVLILKTTERDLEQGSRLWANSFRRKGNLVRPQLAAQGFLIGSPDIVLLGEELEHTEIQALHSIGNCYVSLTRGEGWGLGAFEAAFFGKPVITTGYGGSLAFLPTDKCLLVEYGLVPVRIPVPNRSYTSDQNWADPNEEHAIECMRWVLEHQQAAAERGMALQRYVADNFSFQQVAKLLHSALMSEGGTIQ